MTKNFDMSICEKIIEENFDKLAEMGFDKSEIHKRICGLIDKALLSLSRVEINDPMQERIVTILTEAYEYFAKHMKEGFSRRHHS
jgi:hypothetical protein